MKTIQEAVASYLERVSGVKTVADKSACRAYPMLAVSVREGGTVLIDGGRQAEHTFHVTVTAAADRDRAGNTALLSRLTPLLLRGVPMDGRVLHPLDVKTEGEELTFDVALCVALPRDEGEEWDVMRNIHMGI